MYLKPVKDVGQVRVAIMQWDEEWEVMMSELGEGAKIPDQRKISVLLEICPKYVKEQMLLRLDEVGESYENLKVKVISYTPNKAEQSQGQKEKAVLMELDYVSGCEMYDEEEWDDVHDEGKGYGKGKGKTMKGTGRKGAGSQDVSSEDEKNQSIEDTKDITGRVARQVTSRRSVDGESTTLTLMTTKWAVIAVADDWRSTRVREGQ